MKTFSVSFQRRRPPGWDHLGPFAADDLQTAYQIMKQKLGLEDRVEFTLVQETPHRIIVEMGGIRILVQELQDYGKMILN